MKTTQTLDTVAQTLGLTLTSSAPRPHVEPQWHAIAYDCVLSRNGRTVWEGEYKLGVGHVKAEHWKRAHESVGKNNRNGLTLRPHAFAIEMLVKRPNVQFRDPKAHAAAAAAVAGVLGVAPTLPEVLSWLLTDNPNDASFGEWCAELGYDSDSRKAEGVYNACCEVGRMLRRAFTPEELAQLAEAASNS